MQTGELLFFLKVTSGSQQREILFSKRVWYPIWFPFWQPIWWPVWQRRRRPLQQRRRQRLPLQQKQPHAAFGGAGALWVWLVFAEDVAAADDAAEEAAEDAAKEYTK